jgi:lipoprotein NlpI
MACCIGQLTSACGGTAFVSKARGQYFERQADTAFAMRDSLSPKAKELYTQALDQFNTAVKYDPKDASVFEHRGWCKRRLEDLNGAMTDYAQSLALDPAHSNVWIQRAAVFDDLQEYDKAEEDYEQALHLDKTNANAWAGKATSERMLGKNKESLAAYTEAIKLSPYPHYYCMRANGHRALGDYTSMKADYESALKINPHSWDTYNSRGYNEFVIGDYKNAIKDFETVLHQTDFSYSHAQYAVILGALSSKLTDQLRKEDYFLSTGVQKLELPISSAAGKMDAETGEPWPAPAIQFLRGDISKEAFFKAAGTSRDKLTEVNGYLGFVELANKNKAAAKKYFKEVVSKGNKNFVEYEAAEVQLLSLDKKSSSK